MINPKILSLGYDGEFIEDSINKIPPEIIEEFTIDFINRQKCYFKSMHICKDFIRDKLNLSYHSKAYDKIYRKLICRFARIISKNKVVFHLESLGKGLYRKKLY